MIFRSNTPFWRSNTALDGPLINQSNRLFLSGYTIIKGTVLELRENIARMFGYLNNTAIRTSDGEGFTLALPETGNQYFYVYTDIIKSQYHGDVVVAVLRTVTVKGEDGSYVSKNFERPHYVLLNKKIFDTISINVRDKAGDLVTCEHGKVIITLHFRRSKTQYFI